MRNIGCAWGCGWYWPKLLCLHLHMKCWKLLLFLPIYMPRFKGRPNYGWVCNTKICHTDTHHVSTPTYFWSYTAVMSNLAYYSWYQNSCLSTSHHFHNIYRLFLWFLHHLGRNFSRDWNLFELSICHGADLKQKFWIIRSCRSLDLQRRVRRNTSCRMWSSRCLSSCRNSAIPAANPNSSLVLTSNLYSAVQSALF